MLRNNLIMILLAASASAGGAWAQNPVILTVSQPDPLVADAGPDRNFAPGDTVHLGGNPSARQGSGEYYYQWSPATGLDDPSVPNPVAAPEATLTYRLTVTDANGCQATDEVTLTAGSSGISRHELSGTITCFPNPVAGDLSIMLPESFRSGSVRLLNPVGSVIRRLYPGPHRTEGTIVFPMSDLPSGLYFLQVVDNKDVVNIRIVKSGSHE